MMSSPFLVIDDNPVDLMIIEKLLSIGGVTQNIRKFTKGTEALVYIDEQASGVDHTVILLDMMMPEMDGFAFLDKFENLPTETKKRYSIYMLSSSIDPKDISRAGQNINLNGFINKPLDVEALKVTIASLGL
jgi:CheY-like chemotaxis protein